MTLGSVVLATPLRDDLEAERQIRSKAAHGGKVLAQMKRLLIFLGLKTVPQSLQEAWVSIGAAQFAVIEVSRPRWTFGYIRWVERYCPDLYNSRPASWFGEQVRTCRREQRWYSAADIGNMLGVSQDAFFGGELWDMWPAGCTARERERLRLDRKAAKEKVAYHRSRPAAVPRELSLSRTKPWEALGICRRTWENRRKAGKL